MNKILIFKKSIHLIIKVENIRLMFTSASVIYIYTFIIYYLLYLYIFIWLKGWTYIHIKYSIIEYNLNMYLYCIWQRIVITIFISLYN